MITSHLLDLLQQTQALPFDLRMRLLEQEKREVELTTSPRGDMVRADNNAPLGAKVTT